MKELPSPEIYGQEFKFMPWGKLIQEILDIVKKDAPKDSNILDLMCGPGYLLGKIKELRPDLKLKGVDIDKRFIRYAQEKYKRIEFEVADVLKFKTGEKFDIILCTGGLHHLPYEEQERFVKAIKSLLKNDGFCIIADPYIDDYLNEKERKLGALKLGYEYLIAVIENDAPKEIIEGALDIKFNDVLGYEFKSSIKKNKKIFDKYFSSLEVHKTWPKSDSEYGDYFFILRN